MSNNLDLVLEPQKDAVIKQFEQFKESLDEERMIPVLKQAAKLIIYCESPRASHTVKCAC